MTLRVVFTPEAEPQLLELYRYIATATSPDVAAHFTDAIVDFCDGLTQFPHRGVARDDIRPGLHTVAYRKRTVIAFTIVEEKVAIIGIFYGGRDYAALLGASNSED